jgi:TonB family protein
VIPLFAALLASGVLGAEPGPGAVVPPSLATPLSLPGVLPARRDVSHVVVVELTVEASGQASDVRVVSAPTEALGRLAVELLAAARFRPATRDGVPVAVRLQTPVAFERRAPALAGVARREPEALALVAQAIRGQVLERGTRRPVPGLPVRVVAADAPEGVKPPETEVLTDADGRFAVGGLPRGRYTVEVPFREEGSARAAVSVRAEAPREVTLRITPGALDAFVTRVVDDRERLQDAARVQVSMERAREVPGSSGDPLKVLESLPGVARPAAAGPGAGQLIVRGSAPEDTRFFLDGLPILQLYHFGAIYSVLQDEWIGDIDFRPGGYSTRYGNATAGIVNVTLRDMARDGVHGHADGNIYHLAGFMTAPAGKDWTVGVAARRSWVDAILAGIGGEDGGFRFSSAPRYYDYQARADYHPEDGPRLRLLVFGSDDALVVFGGSPGGADPNASNFALSRSFHQVQGTLEHALSKTVSVTAGLATSYQQLRVSPGSNDFRLTFDPLVLQGDLTWRPSAKVSLRSGVYGEVTRFKVDLRLPLPRKEGEVQLPSEVQDIIQAREEGFSGRADLWAEGTWQATKALGLLAGARLQTWHGNFSEAALDARLASSWEVLPATRIGLAAGLNHQAPAPDESAPSTGSTTLLPERAAYVNLSLSKRFGDLLSVELQGFAKRLDQLVVRTGTFGAEPYDNAGEGSVVGGEALLRLQHPVLDGWIAYTLSRSRRTDRPGQPERYFSFDQTHVLALVAGVQLGAGWRAGARVRYATGNPFTALEPAWFDAGSDVWVPRPAGGILSSRVAGFFQLDVRVAKTFLFDRWRLETYLELNNATNRANIESVQYSDDYRRREDITSLPLTPSLGVRGAF